MPNRNGNLAQEVSVSGLCVSDEHSACNYMSPLDQFQPSWVLTVLNREKELALYGHKNSQQIARTNPG